MIIEDKYYKNIDKHISYILKKDLYCNIEKSICPHCKSSKYIRYGKFNGIQRFRCKDCGRTFSLVTNSTWSYSKKRPEKWIKFIELMLEQKVLRVCAEELEINVNTAFAWRHKVLNALIKNDKTTTLGGIIHMVKTSVKENFKGNKNIKTSKREKIFIVSAKSGSDNMISIPVCKTLWFWNKFEEKIYSRIDQDGYIIPYVDRYIYLAAKKYNKKVYKLKDKGDEVISNFSKLARNWFKRFYGVATKYLVGYLSWFVLFCRDKKFNDIDVIYELIE